jgi:hypothetical protein
MMRVIRLRMETMQEVKKRQVHSGQEYRRYLPWVWVTLPISDVDRRKVVAQEAIKKADGTTLRDLMEVIEDVFLFLQGPLPGPACDSRQPPNASGFWSDFSAGFLDQTVLQASPDWHRQRWTIWICL